jgi:hypothetical protein
MRSPERRARLIARNVSRATHGHAGCGAKSLTYKTWVGMCGRCTNPGHSRFADYGGRGITVDPRWFDFSNFLADMGEKPSPELSLDRVDNDQGYSPSNCRWVTRSEQALNRRPRKYPPLAPERRAKISAAMKGKPWTDARRAAHTSSGASL